VGTLSYIHSDDEDDDDDDENLAPAAAAAAHIDNTYHISHI